MMGMMIMMKKKHWDNIDEGFRAMDDWKNWQKWWWQWKGGGGGRHRWVWWEDTSGEDRHIIIHGEVPEAAKWGISQFQSLGRMRVKAVVSVIGKEDSGIRQ
jgi:hypothetical protein